MQGPVYAQHSVPWRCVGQVRQFSCNHVTQLPGLYVTSWTEFRQMQLGMCSVILTQLEGSVLMWACVLMSTALWILSQIAKNKDLLDWLAHYRNCCWRPSGECIPFARCSKFWEDISLIRLYHVGSYKLKFCFKVQVPEHAHLASNDSLLASSHLSIYHVWIWFTTETKQLYLHSCLSTVLVFAVSPVFLFLPSPWPV